MAAEDGPLICICAGAAEDFLGKVIDQPQTVTGTWVWDGTTTVTTDDTSGVAVGDYVQRTAADTLFEITAIVANVSVTIANPDGADIPSGSGVLAASPVNLDEAVDGTASRPAVLVFEWRRGNSRVFKKTNYDSEEIQVLDQSTNPGQFLMRLDEPDTDAAKVGQLYRYELAVSRQDIVRAGAQGGTAAVTTGDGTLTGTGTTWSEAKPGDIIQATNGAANGQQARVIMVNSDTEVVTDRANWITASGFTFEIRRGKILPGQKGIGEITQSEVRLQV